MSAATRPHDVTHPSRARSASAIAATLGLALAALVLWPWPQPPGPGTLGALQADPDRSPHARTSSPGTGDHSGPAIDPGDTLALQASDAIVKVGKLTDWTNAIARRGPAHEILRQVVTLRTRESGRWPALLAGTARGFVMMAVAAQVDDAVKLARVAAPAERHSAKALNHTWLRKLCLELVGWFITDDIDLGTQWLVLSLVFDLAELLRHDDDRDGQAALGVELHALASRAPRSWLATALLACIEREKPALVKLWAEAADRLAIRLDSRPPTEDGLRSWLLVSKRYVLACSAVKDRAQALKHVGRMRELETRLPVALRERPARARVDNLKDVTAYAEGIR